MSHKFSTVILSFLVIFSFNACSPSDEESSNQELEEEREEEIISDNNITLGEGDFIVCLQTDSFSVTPASVEPDVTILKNITSNEIKISVDSGSIVVSDCLEKLN
ncbi:MAG: hypothetical protein U9P38_09270 [Campylobacterota bacterium]|nr:hypothetical protein [Campylobacterota bacterium]